MKAKKKKMKNSPPPTKLKRFFQTKTFKYTAVFVFVVLSLFLVLWSVVPPSPSLHDGETTKVLVFGGAGYIGSHVVVELLKKKEYTVIVFDNMSEGYNEPLNRVQEITGRKIYFHKGDINNLRDVQNVFEKFKPDVVFHLCARISVPESVDNPLMYYRNNVGGTMNILETMRKFGCDKFVFSSSAAIFGTPENIPIMSNDPTNPINPYGETKLIIEKLLKSCEIAFGLKVASLRYFNAAGADESGLIGEAHRIESHLIPIVLQVALGQREKVFVFGDDYPTPDGTCVRDYVHVTDIALAHIKSLEHLMNGGESVYANLGSGNGNSVMQIINACSKVSGKNIKWEKAARRDGDPPQLVASSKAAEKIFGWERKYTDVEDIIRTAWKWHKQNPNGYQS